MTTESHCPVSDLELFFEDDFDVPSLDINKWHYTQPWANHSEKGFGHSLEYQTDGLNYEWQNGNLNLMLRKEPFYASAIQHLDSSYLLKDGLPNKRWWDYTAGMIYSKDAFGFGKYEIRCKIPKGKGFWSVFWLFGENKDEIDVFEYWNEENIFGNYSASKLSTECHMTTHANGLMCPSHVIADDFSSDYHVYTLVWTNNRIQWFIDGDLKRTCYKFYTITGAPLDCDQIVKGGLYIMDKTYPLSNLHIAVSLGVQAGKNAPDEYTKFPACISVDYIRYWKFKE